MRAIAPCTIPSCGRVEILRRGWCFRHYQRWRNYGYPIAVGVPERRCNVAEVTPNATCEKCGIEFISQHSDRGRRTRFCSRACTRLSDEDREARRLETNEASSRRRRAKKAKVERERYSREAIAARDNFTCWLCGRQVDMTLQWPHPDSPSIDHVIPLSMQGPDTPANVRLAHLAENVARGNRMDWRPDVAS